MKAEALTAKSVADMILEQYKKKYVKGMTETDALALLIMDPRRLQERFILAVPHAAEYIHERKKSVGHKIPRVKRKLRYRRILTTPSTVQVLMIPKVERALLLLTHPKFQKMIK